MNRTVSAALLAVIAGVYAFSFVAPGENPIPGVSACTMRALTGIPCPLCGMTRAFVRISRGDIGGAVGLNALSPLFYAGGLVIAAAFAADLFRLRRFGTYRLGSPPAVVAGVCLVLSVYWIARLAFMAHTGALCREFWLSPLGRLMSQN